MQKRMTPC